MTRPSIPKTTITVPQISVSGCGDSNPARAWLIAILRAYRNMQ